MSEARELYKRGFAHFASSELDDAIALYRQAIEIDGTLSIAWNGLSMALAQQPRLLLLDEPTLHLDICHQVEILEVVKKLNAEQQLTVVASLHDLNLAALYFKRLVLLQDGQIVAEGTPAEVLTEKTIRRVFSTRVKVEPHPLGDVPHIVIMPR